MNALRCPLLSDGIKTCGGKHNRLNWAAAGGKGMLSVIKGHSDAALTVRWWRGMTRGRSEKRDEARRVACFQRGGVVGVGGWMGKRKTARLSEQQLFLIPGQWS